MAEDSNGGDGGDASKGLEYTLKTIDIHSRKALSLLTKDTREEKVIGVLLLCPLQHLHETGGDAI